MNLPSLKILIFCLLGHLCHGQATKTIRPNIILIMADDLGYETIGANGGTSYRTPHIDEIATKGIRFEHCYAQPLCTPSRIQIMTGIYNVRNYVRFGYLDTSQTTFGHLFQKAGYTTCIVGKWQLGKDPSSPQKAGFAEHCLWQVTQGRIDSTRRDTRFSKPVLETNGKLKTYAPNDYGPDVVSEYGLDFIDRSARAQKPFFLYYPMILTHCPFSPTPDSPEWMSDDTTVMTYKGQARYFGDMMAYTDKIIGRIYKKLENLGLLENTLFIFTGDNGTDEPIVSQLGGRQVAGAKGETIDGGTRVPLIAHWSNMIPEGLVNEDLVDFTDFLPTLCEAAGIDHPQGVQLDGRSFLPQLMGKEGNPRDWIYCWYSRNGEDEKAQIFARDQNYKRYRTGEFYKVPEDYLEKKPLDINNLSKTELKVYKQLGKIIAHYQSRRGEDL